MPKLLDVQLWEVCQCMSHVLNFFYQWCSQNHCTHMIMTSPPPNYIYWVGHLATSVKKNKLKLTKLLPYICTNKYAPQCNTTYLPHAPNYLTCINGECMPIYIPHMKLTGFNKVTRSTVHRGCQCLKCSLIALAELSIGQSTEDY